MSHRPLFGILELLDENVLHLNLLVLDLFDGVDSSIRHV